MAFTGIYYFIEDIRPKANKAKTDLDGSDIGGVSLVVVVVGMVVVVVGMIVVVAASLRTA